MGDFKFTIEDVNEWIGCSDEAAKRVWMDSDFAQNMTYYTIGQARLYFGLENKEKKDYKRNPLGYTNKLDCNKHIKAFGGKDVATWMPFYIPESVDKHSFPESENGFSDNAQSIIQEDCAPEISKSKKADIQKAVNKELEDISWEILEKIQNQIKKKKPTDFVQEGLGGFINLVKKNLCYRITDLLEDFKNTVSMQKPIREQDKDSDSKLTIGDSIADNNVLNQEEQLVRMDFIQKCHALACRLLEEFLASNLLKNSREQKNRLVLLRNADDPYGDMGVILFLEIGFRHLEFRNCARQDQSFNQDKWNGYNKRLWINWLKFLDTKTEKILQQLTECKACLSQVI